VLRRTIANSTDTRHVVLESTLFSREAGFGEAPSQMIATAVSELATNILKYAHSGEICLKRVQSSKGRGIEISATDRGPGIADVEAAMRDHVSSSGTLGLGLPGIRRLMDEFALESTPGEGTRVTARKWI